MNKETKVETISVSSIEVGQRFRQESSIEDLKCSIRDYGLIHPIAVQRGEGGSYQLLAGHRRLRACMELGHETIHVNIYDHTLDKEELRIIELLENIDREDFTWQERVALTEEIHKLHIAKYGSGFVNRKEGGWTIQDTARTIGRELRATKKQLMLASAIRKIPELGKLPTSNEAEKTLSSMLTNLQVSELVEQLEAKQADSGIDKVRQDLCSCYKVCDVLEGLKEAPDNYFDLAEVDPPYGIDLPAIREGSKNKLGHTTKGYTEVGKTHYLDFLGGVLEVLCRKMKPDCWVLFWFASDGWADSIAGLLDTYGFSTCWVPALWLKPSGASANPKYRLGNYWESFYYARRGDATIVKQGRGNVFAFSNKFGSKTHPAEKPVELMQEILETFILQGSRVIVPFAGSGSTLLAASNLHIESLGFDLSQDYKNTFVKKVHKGKPGSYRSLK